MKIALTGSTGLVGSRIVELLQNDFEFIPVTQSEVDITDRQSVEKKLGSIDFDLFLHLAAYTNVDGAEKEKELAHKINVEGTKNVFDTVQKKSKKFIYISTGFVFDGTKPPYYEDSKPHPLGQYSLTKYQGEQVIGNRGMIVRIEYPYRAAFDPKKDFVRAIKARLESGQPVAGITDSIITPTFIYDISFALKHLFTHYSPEVYHIVGADSLSPYEASLQIAKTYNLDSSLVHKITFDEYFKDKAPRPRKAEVKSKKNDFYTMKTFKEGLEFIRKMHPLP